MFFYIPEISYHPFLICNTTLIRRAALLRVVELVCDVILTRQTPLQTYLDMGGLVKTLRKVFPRKRKPLCFFCSFLSLHRPPPSLIFSTKKLKPLRKAYGISSCPNALSCFLSADHCESCHVCFFPLNNLEAIVCSYPITLGPD